ncbi:hypothetical protein F441_04342 [Phytophthora nicotianae CJ01A1]|uniref:PiggyBac transposable element-derived protein domain-containing protein n=1 Tax=Phytophthora nicotianae CJ01A1 TaxID=1317063 RepID=W2XIU4_PHYNI|nr:hypothetical protein F441_04342 [Phytophthora nicotianae CJ01A1]
MAFASRWRELKKDCWRSRRPTGLSNDFTYLKPGKTKKDVRRTDYFVGEGELMRYLDTLDLEQPAGEAAHETSAGAGKDNVGASLRNESLLAQGSRLATPSPENNAVIVEGSPHGISYPSADESVESNESESLPGTIAAADSRIRHRIITLLFCRLITEPQEARKRVSGRRRHQQSRRNLDGDGYVRLESDSENDEGVSWDADDLLADNSQPLDDEEISPPPEMLFDRSLLDAVGGVGTVERGALPIELLGEMAERGWSAPTTQTPYDYLLNRMSLDLPTQCLTTIHGCTRGSSPALWDDIASASEDYYHESLDDRVEGQFAKQVARKTKHPGFKRKTREQIREELEQAAEITGRELCVFIGLLIARSVGSNKEKLENHWKTVDEGAIPRGCFGQFMVCDRFMHISRNLHFSSNSDERARTDKAWKLRPVIDALQARFQSGYIPPAIMAFDEAMLPSRSSFNKMRVYMKDKPHKWGTKLFMLCCSTTAYCIR